MASKRPAFARVDTDHNGESIAMSSNVKRPSSLNKDGTYVDSESLKSAKADIHRTYSPDDELPAFDAEAENKFGQADVVHTAEDVVTHVIHVDDDITISPWTFRAFIVGIGIAIFASVLQEIFYFKPQTIYVSVTFLTVVAYPICEFLSFAIPRKGAIGRFLNPFPFNGKEHAAIAIMASSSATAAVATEILAAQKLYYNETPNAGAAIFLVIAAQLFGYGIAGLMRNALVRPTKLLWPMNLPINSLLETLHRDKKETSRRLRIFYYFFFAMLVYEIVPEYMFPLLQGVSIFCLAKQDSLVFTNIFGGSQGNEGLGFLSLCFDWQYIASLGSPLWIPLQTQLNSLVGYLLCIIVFCGMYYGNIYRSQDFPFLSQLLYNGNGSNGSFYQEYNLSAILNSNNEIDTAAVAEQGIPYLTGTYIAYLITTNMGSTAAIVTLLLFNRDELKGGFLWARWSVLKSLFKAETWKFWVRRETKEQYQQRVLADPSIDPHYKLMIKNGYEDVPMWWFGMVFLASFVIGMGTLYAIGSTLPWWGYIMSNIFAAIFILFFGVQYGVTGFQFNQQPIIQMLAGYMHPGKPLANMYFTVFGFNGVQQGQLLARDLKLAQYAHLSFKATFTFQMLGCIIGAIFNYIMMQSIVTNQSTILKASEGSNIWSGQNVQQYNTLAIAWSIAGDMFSVGARYQWVTISYLVGFVVPLPFYFLYRYTGNEQFRYWNMSIILWYMGWLFVGINASIGSYFILGIGAQWWLRKYRPQLFVNYNYLVSAALDGGTQVLVFILSFAVFGGSGTARPFPTWAGNNGGVANNKNIDFCAYNTAQSG
ncbi:OPT superfamily oligopeptide transporter [Myriangium duriaei CBS 260.36]|uniref:OPT superfamily oligopeptide transporter n=1 Tax=Myriangium duriaei CBS 260.36 TaxID=1168546 RepID=A0A9P4J4L2_9PEZI|nr:OPT superfamily oligopeptide transporter [Myriangium duriaei CBS 260.36]